MQFQNRRLVILISFAVVALFIVAIVLSFHSKPKPGTQSGQHVDSFSHETVSNPPGKGPDSYGTPPNQPVYLGFDKLLDFGLGYGQLKNVQTAFYRYSSSLAKPIGQISVDVDHISSKHDPANPNSDFEILFKVQFDEKNTYQAKVVYTGINDVRLIVTSLSGGKTIYDSGVLYSSLQSD